MRLKRLLLLFVLAGSAVLYALASDKTSQDDSANASIGGIVWNARCMGIPHAKVTLAMSQYAEAPRFTFTDEKGHFLFSGLPGGFCTLSTEKEGFKTTRIKSIEIQSPKRTEIRVGMEEGARAEVVEQYGESVRVEVDYPAQCLEEGPPALIEPIPSSIPNQLPTPSGALKDPLIGKWVLDVAGSTLPPVDSWITIEAVGDKYRISWHFIGEHGTDSESSTVTAMKGELSKVKKSYSTSDKQIYKQPDEEWRVTRESPAAFVVESLIGTDRYTVSSDGKTLTDDMIDSKLVAYHGPANPIKGSVKTIKTTQPVLVYDKTDH